jgi:hypothetical protein
LIDDWSAQELSPGQVALKARRELRLDLVLNQKTTRAMDGGV